MKLTLTDIKELKKVRRNLMKIKLTGTAPINLTFYKKEGLVKEKTYRTRSGYIKKVKLYLTVKGKRILEANI